MISPRFPIGYASTDALSPAPRRDSSSAAIAAAISTCCLSAARSACSAGKVRRRVRNCRRGRRSVPAGRILPKMPVRRSPTSRCARGGDGLNVSRGAGAVGLSRGRFEWGPRARCYVAHFGSADLDSKVPPHGESPHRQALRATPALLLPKWEPTPPGDGLVSLAARRGAMPR